MQNIVTGITKGKTNPETVQSQTIPEYVPMDIYVNPRMVKAHSKGALMLLTLTRSYLAAGSTRCRSAL